MSTVIIILSLLVAFLSYYLRQISHVSAHQHWMFEELKFSTQDFYTYTEALIVEKQLPSVKIGRVYHSVKGLFSARREYLRVQYHRYFFDICAAPFARDFFISWRQGQLRQLIDRRREKTFYEQDTELMFKESIKVCVERAIERMKEKTGRRTTVTTSEVPLFQ